MNATEIDNVIYEAEKRMIEAECCRDASETGSLAWIAWTAIIGAWIAMLDYWETQRTKYWNERFAIEVLPFLQSDLLPINSDDDTGFIQA